MARYLDLRVLQEPFPIGVDDSRRPMYGFNLIATKTVSATFLEEIASLLIGAGVGVLGSTLFLGQYAAIPTGDGPYVSVIDTVGASDLRIHNSLDPVYPRPAARIVVRCTNPVVARATAQAAYTALAGVRNATVTP